jgi:two-component system response regulator VicR
MKILIAEDDPVMLAIIKHQLIKEDHTISSNTDVSEALASLETFKPDLIITDILMPFASGLELIGIVRSRGIAVPILVLSALNQEATVMEALSLGANDFLAKPFNAVEFSGRVKRLLEQSSKEGRKK